MFFIDGKFKGVKRTVIEFTKEPRARHIKLPGIAALDMEAILGVDPNEDVRLINLRNVIHGNEHVLSHSTHIIGDRASGGRTLTKTASTAPFVGTARRGQIN